MNVYQNYTSEDFIQDEYFRHWVFAPNEDTIEFWQNFLIENSEKKAEVTRARALLLAMQQLENNPSQHQGRRMWEAISKGIESKPQIEKPAFTVFRSTFQKQWLSIAATVALFGAIFWFMLSNNTKPLPQTYEKQVAQLSERLTEKVNSKNHMQQINLPDGSIVQLSPGGKLSFEKGFAGNQRKVYLSGQGYFEVVKNEAKPFLVFANNLVTQVVGTSFTVNSAQSNIGISVIVKSGKVKVYTLESNQQTNAKKQQDEVMLTPNQQATYDPIHASLTKSIVANPEIIRKPEKFPDFNFDNTSIKDVFATLEQSYGVKIHYNLQTLENCNLKAQLSNEPLFKKLDIICRTIDATYEVWGTKIVVTGKGCTTE